MLKSRPCIFRECQELAGNLKLLTCQRLLFLLLFPLVTWANNAKDPLIVKTTKGLVQGFSAMSPHGKSLDAFFAIPFAQPPVGELRFQHPLPAQPWDGILNASIPSKSCYQPLDNYFPHLPDAQMWNANTPLSEDCLYLNVWIPRPRPTNAAVMVWFYGGGFFSGSMTLEVYDGSTLATEENVIVVSFQYRTGALGFLYLDTPDTPGNAAMYDQIMALRWVKDNIHSFGGNPNNITLFGESAGATSISLHLLSPISRGLFNQAIMVSGSATCPWATLAPQEAINRAILLAEGVRLNGVSCRMDPVKQHIKEIIQCLRNADATEIIEKEPLPKNILDFTFAPIVDGEFMPVKPDSMLRKGNFKKTNIMVGSLSEEGTYWILYHFDKFFHIAPELEAHLTQDDLEDALGSVFRNFSAIARDAIIFQYTDHVRPADPVNNADLLEKAVGDYFFTCNVNELASAYAKAGQNVHMFYFNHRSSTMKWPKWMGVPHGYEIEFVFGWPLNATKGYTREEVVLSKRMMNYWANFAKTGNPSLTKEGGYSKHPWPIYTDHGKEHLVLNTKDPVVKRGIRANYCAFWKQYLPTLMKLTANIDEVEAQWKAEFHEWNTRYIVDWKAQFDRYVRQTNKLQAHNMFGGHDHDDL